jgi:ATP-dependent DNA helicase RecG
MRKWSNRDLMELAIEEMKKTIIETRDDGKISPSVGAVLLKSDGSVEKAHRSEFRIGDHAEYTLLDKKNTCVALDNSELFTTLEPCVKASRGDNRDGCAERIVAARINKVWIGIEDPDPKVDRMGIIYLQEHNVKVEMFDRDLQENIFEYNKNFIDQAKQRAFEEKYIEKPHQLFESIFARIYPEFTYQDFSEKALDYYRERTNIQDSISSDPFKQKLVHQGYLKNVKNTYTSTGLGILVFYEKPRDVFPQAGLLVTVNGSDGGEEIKDFSGPLILIPDQIEEWLISRFPIKLDRNRMVHQLRSELPIKMIREAIINALVHRDYQIEGAKCHLRINDDEIIIQSPGQPVDPITLNEMQKFNARILSRNPKLHHVFGLLGLAEERGIGMKTFSQSNEDFNLPLPKFSYDPPYLTLTIYRGKESALITLPNSILIQLNNDERRGWALITTRVEISKNDYSKTMGFDDRKAQRHLKKFFELGLLERIGSGPATKYRLKTSK